MLVVVLMAALSSYAQEMYLGGGISLWRDCDADINSFSISPDFGYNLNERWAIGAELALLTKERITMREKTEFHHTSTALPLLRTLVILSTKTKSYVCSSIWD